MFVLGHSILGPTLVDKIRRGLPMRWLVVGGLLPDLIDKPLYYSLVALTGKRGIELGLISGSRTIGHTGLFLLLFVLLAMARRSLSLTAIAWGIASHLFLDNLGDAFGRHDGTPTAINALLFPLLGFHFPYSPFHNVGEHLASLRNWYVLLGETLGAILLAMAIRRRLRK